MRKSVDGSPVPGTRKRVIRSAHPGVVLLKPDAVHNHPTWRARFVDPDTGRSTKVRLDPVALRTAEARRDWAIRKSRSLAQRAMAIEGGAARATGTALPEAIKRYYEAHTRLRPATLEAYRAAGSKLAEWAARTGVRSADELTGPRLVAFRAELLREPRRARDKGGKRGAVKLSTGTRSPHTVNRELRSVRTILGYLRKLGLLPRISDDDLKDGLERLAVGSERIDYRRPAELQQLLEAALRHDAATYAATREEHAGKRAPGSTLRYEPIAPLVAAAMVTGMRYGELITLDWSQVDLEALDNDGTVVGEIHLSSATKTKRARTIGLEVSPALRTLLAAMHLNTGGKGSVFGHTEDGANSALRRAIREYGAPAASGWQALRRTCGTFLTNSPGIFGSASAYRSAKQLGHSVAVAERHYVGVIRGISRDARTLEQAMQIETQMAAVIAAVGSRA